MKYWLKKLMSISNSLSSTNRSVGPNLKLDQYDISLLNNDSDSDFANNTIKIVLNSPPSHLYKEELIENNNSCITNLGSLRVISGAKTGRSPKDKRIVKDDNTKDIWWSKDSPNIEMDDKNFLINRETAICFLNNQKKLYVFDGYAGWDLEHKIKVRVICTRPYHALFMNNMLIRPNKNELLNFDEPDFVIYNAGVFPCNRYTGYMTSSTSIDFNFTRKEIVILGTQYAGEMKKGIFTVMHYLMPKINVLSLHSSANQDNNGNSTLFFGLSGTGKTTLSADTSRNLIGDDEHCWTDTCIFNIEGGCYAKCINLDKNKEPVIYNCIKFGSLLENVIINTKGDVDFDDISITPNTRVSYPLEFIENGVVPAIGNHPTNIVFLTCDAFGILPPVSKLSVNQALYYFISGYTAKIPGTEQGIKLPEATFSACFGEAFIVWHPMRYAELLKDKIEKHNTNIWLVNTGWQGGLYGIGRRYPLKFTRTIIDSINNNTLVNCEYEKIDEFNLEYPKEIQNLDCNMLNPINTWTNKNEYYKYRNKLSNMFKENFKKYSDHPLYNELIKVGPI